MAKASHDKAGTHPLQRHLPLIIEQDKKGGYVVECPILPGCYTQGETYEEAIKNIQEVIEMLLEEEENRVILQEYVPNSVSFHTIMIEC